MTKNRKIRRWLMATLALVIIWTMCLSVSAETASGRCGSRLYWSYDGSSGTLSFTGTGAMFSYATQSAPWLAYAQEIQTITFEKGITTISDRAFLGCVNLQTVTVPGTVTSLGASAFENCVSLTSLPLSAGSCVVGDNAFKGCTGLTSLVIPEGVTSVGASAFENCRSVQSLSIPASLTALGTGALRGCSALTQIQVAEKNTAYSAAGNCLLNTEGVLLLGTANSQIPQDGSVVTIGADAFRNQKGITSISIPNSVTVIEDYAFQGCTGLSQVTFGNDLVKLGTGAFQGCSGLRQLTLPNTLEIIGTCAFSGCTALTEVNFPLGLVELGSWSFANTKIGSVSLSADVAVVGINPFRGCRDLTSITVNYRNRSYKAVNNCLISSSDKVLVSGCLGSRIPENTVIAIGRDAFRGMPITQMEIPGTVETIEEYAFADSDLISLEIGAGVKKIEGNPLVGCRDLMEISVSEDNEVYDSQNNCLLAGSILIAGCENSLVGDTVTQIGPEAFCGVALTEIRLPEGVTKIGKRAFFGCRELQVVQLPDSITHIGESAFELSGLRYLSLGSLPQIDSYAFLGCYELKNIHTPDMAKLQKGATTYGYIAYYADRLASSELTPVIHYINSNVSAVYMSLGEALENYTEGWLQLGGPVQENVTLSRDTYIDLAGHDLGGVMNTAGYTFYGMDSATNDYTCENTGRFTCVTPTGSAIVPVKHFESDVTGDSRRYMTVQEEAGYSFHRFFVDLTHSTLNITQVGVGYKAMFRGDDKVKAQLHPQEAFSYELCLQGFLPVNCSVPAEELVSGEPISLRVNNYEVEEYGETPLSAWVNLKLADGTVIRSENYTITLRSLTESINDRVDTLTDEQLEALLEMMDTYPVMKSWKVAKILTSARRNWRYV